MSTYKFVKVIADERYNSKTLAQWLDLERWTWNRRDPYSIPTWVKNLSNNFVL